MKNSRKSELFIFVFFIFFVISVLITTFFSNHYLQKYSSMLQKNVSQRLMQSAQLASTLTSAEELSNYVTMEDTTQPSYAELQLKLRNFAEERELMFVYFMRVNGDQLQYIIDSDPNPETQVSLDDFTPPDTIVMRASKGETVCNELGVYSEEWQGILAAYTPVFDSNGNVAAIAGVDMDDTPLIAVKKRATFFNYMFVFEVLIVLLTCLLMVILYGRQARASQSANAAKSQVLARMSHEIRTPMNAIIGFCRMAISSNDVEQIKDYLDNISKSSKFLLQLVNNILDISKIEEGKMSLDISAASPRAIIENVQAMVLSQAESKEQTLVVEIGCKIPEKIYCDNTHLSQVLINLLSNAVKFTPTGGKIYLSAELDEIKNNRYNLVFNVRDTGIGIKEEYHNILFEPFEQGDGSFTREYEGSGLGLAISKLIVEMMGGSIRVSSKPGEGATFTFNGWFDIVTDIPESTASDESSIAKTIDCTGLHFLVVEDNEINQLIAGNTLEEFGAQIDYADNGQTGINMFMQFPERYDIIFMDIQMPVLDGYEATKMIRESDTPQGAFIPIIAMTANVFKEDVDYAMSIGMNAHIGKPIEVEHVARAIIKVLPGVKLNHQK